MLKIEIWKCRPSWLAESASERIAIMKRFSSVIQNHLDEALKSDGGPYLIEKVGACLLIWTWETRNDQVARAFEELQLRDYFEPLVDVRVSPGLSAKALAERLR